MAFKGIGAATYATLKIDSVSLKSTATTGVGSVSAADAAIVYANGVVSCEGAVSLDAYTFSGSLIGHSDGSALFIGTPGAVIVRATTADGVKAVKLIAE